jgi:hypothetical protein
LSTGSPIPPSAPSFASSLKARRRDNEPLAIASSRM